MINIIRSGWVNDEDEDTITREDFDKRLKILNSKCKDKYSFTLKSGNGLKNCIFELFCKIWATENKPEQWRNTIIIQLFKSKGDPSDFNNQRNIHTKEEYPKFFLRYCCGQI